MGMPLPMLDLIQKRKVMPARGSQSRSNPRPAKEAILISARADETIPVVARGAVSCVRLVQVAYQLSCQKGFHSTSLRDIAENAEGAVGGIDNHFKDKDDIFSGDGVIDIFLHGHLEPG